MTSKLLFACGLALLSTVASFSVASFSAGTCVAEETAVVATDSVVLFDGKTLDGWAGREGLWSAEDGQIVGRTTDEDPIDGNTFLIYDGEEFGDFELTAEFKIEGGNSGIQYRSRVIDADKHVVSGYQADIDDANKFAGILYEEKARGILALRGETVTIGADGEMSKVRFGNAEKLGLGIHPGKWNDFRVVAEGNHLKHFINGTLTAEVIDEQSEKAATSGIIALQLHKGPAMTVRFKNLKVRKL